MKRMELMSIYQFLGKLKLNKIADKATRNGLITNHLRMYSLMEKISKDEEEIRKKYIEGKESEIKAFEEAVQNNKEINPETEALVKEFNEVIDNFRNEEVNVEVVAVSQDGFCDAIAAQDVDITMGDIIFLKNIGILKEDES